MQPEQVLDLIRTASERYNTVRAALRYRGDGRVIKTVRERFLRSEAGRHTFREPQDPSEPIPQSEPDGPFGWGCRVWRVDHHRWRQELDLPGGGLEIKASTGRMRSRGTPEGPPGTSELWERRVGGGRRQEDPGWLMGTDIFWTMYPFDSADIAGVDSTLGQLDLVAEGPMTWAGREAVRLRGVPVEEWDGPPEPLWWGADEYEAVVDAERGVILRLASRLDGEDFDALEVEEIFFDEPLGAEVFFSREPLPWR